jgi:hypothetical protein
MSKYSIEELVAVNDLFHTMLWEQRSGREVTEMMINDRIYKMLAGEEMDRTSLSVSFKLAQIQAMRLDMNLDGLEYMMPIYQFSDIDQDELMRLIGSYEFVFKCMEEEQAGHRDYGRMPDGSLPPVTQEIEDLPAVI